MKLESYVFLISNWSVNTAVFPRVASDGRCLMILNRVMSLSDVSVQQELHREAFSADGTPVEIGRVAC